MPEYGTGPVQTVNQMGAVLWNDETVAANACSQAACMYRNPNLPNCLSIELLFAADPGAFAVELQVADTDEDKYYVTKATLDEGLNPTFAGRIEATNVIARFVRLKMVSLANAVNVSAKVF